MITSFRSLKNVWIYLEETVPGCVERWGDEAVTVPRGEGEGALLFGMHK